MNTKITQYLPSDKHDCLEAFKSNVPTFFTKEEILDFENFLTRLESDTNKTRFYVIKNDNKIIGCGGFGDRENNGIYSLAWGLIHKDFHKKGYGEELLLYRLEQIEILGIKFPIVIDTSQFSYGFFEKYGFKVTKITHDYYEKGMDRYDMILDV